MKCLKCGSSMELVPGSVVWHYLCSGCGFRTRKPVGVVV